MISNQGEVAVSIIVPAHNEEESLPHLHRQITAAMAPLGVQWQVVYVDDGSTDRTFQTLEAIAQHDPHASVVQLRRNFGQTAAIAAGIDHSSGEIIILADADLQNDPADIPRLLAKLEEGYDIVSGWRKNRADPWWSRRLPSVMANAIISRVTGVRLHDYGCTLKAYRREVLQDIELYGEMHRLIPALAASIGARISEIEVHHRGRRFGKSKYGIGRTLKVVLDLLTIKFLSSYLTKPIYVFGAWGFALACIGLILTAVVLVEKIGSQVYVHRNPLAWIAGFSFVSALQLVLMGLLAELVVRTYHESQGRPIYFVRQVVAFQERTTNVRHLRIRQ
jgi:glycosyltransferase involved in cell wall biosynthesis